MNEIFYCDETFVDFLFKNQNPEKNDYFFLIDFCFHFNKKIWVTPKIYQKILQKYGKMPAWTYIQKIISPIDPPIEADEDLPERAELQLALNWALATGKVCLLTETDDIVFPKQSSDFSAFINQLKIITSRNVKNFMENEVFKENTEKLARFSEKLKNERAKKRLPAVFDITIDFQPGEP